MDMREIAIYGAGGLGREIACLLEFINSCLSLPGEEPWNLVGFFDDGIPVDSEVSHFGRVLGGIEELNSWSSPLAVVLAFGTPKIREAVSSRILNDNISFPNIISPDFVVTDEKTFSIGKGNVITGHCSVTTDVAIGDFNLLNGDVVFGHDVKVGNCNVFMPACRISGDVTIGNGCLFGAMSFVKQCLKIGDGVTLSPLSPLLVKPKPNSIYIGNPAKIFKV